VAKSTWILFQGPEGHVHGQRGAAGGAFSVVEHCRHALVICSRSASNLGHHTWLQAMDFILATSG